MVFIGEVERLWVRGADGEIERGSEGSPEDFAGDQRWPMQCACGYAFTDEDARQVFTRQLYRRTDDPRSALLPESLLPVGAMWNNTWMSSFASGQWTGPDGRSVHVKLPDGHVWCVDGRANNCTMKDDSSHKCWVRHGDVTKGEIHVDKNGHTCKAGAGSIDTGKWHGFLHGSILKPA